MVSWVSVVLTRLFSHTRLLHACVCVCVRLLDNSYNPCPFKIAFPTRWMTPCLFAQPASYFWRNIINAHWNFHPHESAQTESLCVHLWIRVWCLYRADTGGKQKQTFLEHLISQWKQMKAASLYSMLQLNINYIQTARFDFIKCSHRRSG